jgi:hypothetical protein
MNLLYFLLIGAVISLLINSPIMGLVVAAITIIWLAALWWPNRHVPHDPRDY